MDGVNTDLRLIHLIQRILQCLNGALNICLNNEVKLLYLGICHGVKEVLQRYVLHAILLLDTSLEGALICQITRITLIGEHAELIACHRNALQAQNFYCVGRTGLCNGMTLGIHHSADATKGHASDKSITNAQRTTGDKNGSNRATTTIKLGLKDVAGSKGRRIALKLQNICFKQDGFKQVINANFLLGRDVYKHVGAAPLLRNDAMLGKLLAYTSGVRTGLIDLIDRNNNGYVRRLGMVDGLDGLRHHAVIRSNNQNNDIGYASTTSTHGGKGLVTRGINKGNGTTLDLNLRCTNCLSNAARLTSSNAGVTNGIQKRSLTVIDVAHNRNHGRPGLQILGIIVEGKGILLFLGHNLYIYTQVVRHQLNELIGHRLGHRKGGTQQEQALDNIISGYAEKLC